MTRILATADFVVGNCARETSLRDEKSAYDAVHNNTRRRVLRTRPVGRLGLLYNIIGSTKSESDCVAWRRVVGSLDSLSLDDIIITETTTSPHTFGFVRTATARKTD